MKAKEVWKSGFVRRWHSHPDLASTNQTNAAHQWGVAIIAMHLFPDDDDLLKAALLHDVGEVNLGDLSAPAKRSKPILAKAYKEAEDLNMATMDVPIPECSKNRLDLCDMLEAFLWVQHHQREVLETISWLDQIQRMCWIAEEEGVLENLMKIVKP